MEDEFLHNNPQDLVEEIFHRLEAQVIYINCNINLLMEDLVRNIGPFRDEGRSKFEIISTGKSRYLKDPGMESWK